MLEEEGSFNDWELTSPSMRVEAPGRTVFFLTEFQINGMLEALRLDLVDRMSSFRLMEGTVSGDSLGNYRLALSVGLSEEEGNRLVHQLAGLDRVESPDKAETPRLWEEGADPGPEYDDNQDL